MAMWYQWDQGETVPPRVQRPCWRGWWEFFCPPGGSGVRGWSLELVQLFCDMPGKRMELSGAGDEDLCNMWYSSNTKQLSKESRPGSTRCHLSCKLGPSWEWNRAESKLTQTRFRNHRLWTNRGMWSLFAPGWTSELLGKTLLWVKLGGLSQHSLLPF